MESMRRRIDIKLVSSEKRLQKLINKTTFKHCTAYNETLCAVSLENKIINFCKPIYIGKYFYFIFIKKKKYFTVTNNFVCYVHRICRA